MSEPGLDLPLALALASSLRDRPIAPGTVVIGEVGLLGELRGVAGLERRLREAARLGFARAIVPARRAATDRRPTIPGVRIDVVGDAPRSHRAALARAAAGRSDAVPAMLG